MMELVNSSVRAVPVTDQSTSTLTITYDNGLLKTINDYGMQGTRGLKHLYKSLAQLRFSVSWELQSESLENASELNQ